MVLAVGTIFLAIVQFLILQRQVPNIFPLLLVVVLKLPVLEFGLALPQFFLFGGFVELLLGADERQLILLLVLVLEVLEDGVDVVTAALDSAQPRPVVLQLVDLLENVGVHRVVLAGLLEFLLCGSENLDVLVLFRSVQFGTLGLLLEDRLLPRVLRRLQVHPLEVLVLQDPEVGRTVLSGCRSLAGGVLEHRLDEVQGFGGSRGDDIA